MNNLRWVWVEENGFWYLIGIVHLFFVWTLADNMERKNENVAVTKPLFD